MTHHSDAGSQYTAIRFTDTVALEGLVASIGSAGDAYDNAAAETVMGPFKNEAVAAGSPFRDGPLRQLADVERLTTDYVHWYNRDRLHGELGQIPPEVYEQAYNAPHRTQHPGSPHTGRRHETRDGSPHIPGAVGDSDRASKSAVTVSGFTNRQGQTSLFGCLGAPQPRGQARQGGRRMSDHISWESCPQCRRSAAVGWIDGYPVEFDCLSRCPLTISELHELAAEAGETAARGEGRAVVAAGHGR
jgi:hypothetical protein